MGEKATFIHADGRATTVEAPFLGKIEVVIGEGISCVKATNVFGSTVNTVCMGTPNPVSSPGGDKSDCGCKK